MNLSKQMVKDLVMLKQIYDEYKKLVNSTQITEEMRAEIKQRLPAMEETLIFYKIIKEGE